MKNKPVPSFPFPERNSSYPDHLIYFIENPAESSIFTAMFQRSQSEEARHARFQYMSIESELETSFHYVSPTNDNAKAYSIKFANIIRMAANFYEILAKDLYVKFYNKGDRTCIFNYLALDAHLLLSRKSICHLAALSDFPEHPETTRPFFQLIKWDRMSLISSNHVPNWWNAYNKIKHADEGIRDHANLANAIASVAAIYLLVESIFGFGVLSGGFHTVGKRVTGPGSYQEIHKIFPQWARLFTNHFPWN